MPLIRKWKATPLVWQLAVLLSVSLVVIGGLMIALVAYGAAHHSGQESTSAVRCLNRVLGDRSGLTVKSAQAQKAFADADKKYNEVLNSLFVHPAHNPKQQAAELQAFKAAQDAKYQASVAYSKTMAQIVAVAVAHPLGHC